MGREITQQAELLLANFALVFSCVRPHMGREITQQAELLLANFAPMQLLSHVHQVVVPQIGLIRETLLANVAFVWTFASVCP